MVTHELKTWPEYFGAVLSGIKTFEVRKLDRSFAVGDKLLLREYSAGEYTGRDLTVNVTYMLAWPDPLAVPGYAVMAITPMKGAAA